MEGLSALVIIGLLIWGAYQSAYRAGKREGSRKGYGVGFERGQRKRGQSECTVALLLIGIPLAVVSATMHVGCRGSSSDVESGQSDAETQSDEHKKDHGRLEERGGEPAEEPKLKSLPQQAIQVDETPSLEALFREIPGGIGVRCDLQGDYPVITEVIEGGAADQQGTLKVGDRLLKVVVEGDHHDPVDLKGRHSIEVSCYLAGKKGTRVTLFFTGADQVEVRSVSLVRDTDDQIRDVDGSTLGFRIAEKDTRKSIFAHYSTLCRFPGSPRFYALVPEDKQASLKAFPEKQEGRRLAFITNQLFPEYDASRQRMELKLFCEMFSPLGLSMKGDAVFARLIENNPSNDDLVIIHAKMVKYNNSSELYGRIEEIMFLNADKPDRFVPLGVEHEYDSPIPIKEPIANDGGLPTVDASAAPAGLSRLGYKKRECLICLAERSSSALANHSDKHGFGLCDRCGAGVNNLKQAQRLQERGIAPPPEVIQEGRAFGTYIQGFISRDASDTRRAMILLILTNFGTPDWDSFAAGE